LFFLFILHETIDENYKDSSCTEWNSSTPKYDVLYILLISVYIFECVSEYFGFIKMNKSSLTHSN
jgi:hypothetical protein